MSKIKSEVVSGQSLDPLDFWKDPLIFEFIIIIGYLCMFGDWDCDVCVCSLIKLEGQQISPSP